MIEIRPATLADLEALLPLVRDYRVFYKRSHDAEHERAVMEANLREKRSAVFVAWKGERAAGFMQLFHYVSTVCLSPTVILEDLFVDPEFRDAGVATLLLEHSLVYAETVGASELHLETAVDNLAAQRVYERCGWSREAKFYKYNAPAEAATLAVREGG